MAESKRKRIFSRDGLDHVWIIEDEHYSFCAPVENPKLYFYDYDEGQRWVNWFAEFMVHTDGALAGQPIDPLLPWVEAFIRELFGWRFKETGFRRYEQFHAHVPGKNAKTQMGCGIAQGLAVLDEEQGAQVFWTAGNKEQAERTCFKMVKDMYDLNPLLRTADDGLFDLQTSSASLFHPPLRSVLQILSSIPKNIHGYNPHGVIGDEPHEAATDEVINTLWAKSITRRQPLLGYISTSGNNKEHWYYKKYQDTKELIEHKKVNDRILGFVREADPRDKLDSIETWKKANPGLGRSVRVENLKSQWKEALDDPAKMDLFKQCQLNIWVERTSKAVSIDHWDLCKRDYKMIDLVNDFCVGGFDLSHTRDMTAFSLCFPNWQYDDTGSAETARRLPRFLTWYWVPEEVYEKNKLYQKWDEYIERTPGNFIDKAFIKRRIKEIRALFPKLKKTYYDPWHSLDIFVEINDDDFECVPLEQSFKKMGPAIQELSDLVAAGQMEHDGNPVRTWNVKNAKVRLNSEGFKLLAKPADDKKIDGWVSCNIAYAGTMFEKPPEQDASSYFKDGWSM